jgi:hypothetical protein
MSWYVCLMSTLERCSKHEGVPYGPRWFQLSIGPQRFLAISSPSSAQRTSNSPPSADASITH